MPSGALCIPSLISGGLITNYNCTSTCRHCLYRCSPAWPNDYMDVDTAIRNLHVARELGCAAVHIGGGEPMLKTDRLGEVLEVARGVGVYVEYVETNSSWYHDHYDACIVLEKLALKGLTTLLVSMSPFHNEFIPFAKVKGVMRACNTVGIGIFPWISDFASELSSFDEDRTHSLQQYMQRFDQQTVANLPARYWISMGGRALETFAKYQNHRPVAQIVAENAGGCAELEQTSHFHLDLYGNYVPGLCAGLAIRREDLGKRLSREAYPVLSALYARGVGGLLDYAASAHHFRPRQEYYGHKCQLCHEIRRHLVLEATVDSHELQPRGHYLYG